MATVPLKNLAGEDLGSIDLSDTVFAVEVNEALVHQAVVRLQANARLGTHKTKTRGNVSGGGAKPWRQKGTGRARQGSRVSPLWRGGGTVFGPSPRSYRQDMPKKMRQAAMRSALSSRCADGQIIALDSFEMSEPHTKALVESMSTLGFMGKVVVVDDQFEENAVLSARNIGTLELRDAAGLNLMDVLRPEHLVFTKSALVTIESRLGGDKLSTAPRAPKSRARPRSEAN
jgi:large subunit ribosomal protein L4